MILSVHIAKIPHLPTAKLLKCSLVDPCIQSLSSLCLKNDFNFKSFFFMQTNRNLVDPIVAAWNGSMLDLRMCLHDVTNRIQFVGSFTYSFESSASVLSVQNIGIHRWPHYVYFKVVPWISAIVHGPPIQLAVIRGFWIWTCAIVSYNIVSCYCNLQ